MEQSLSTNSLDRPGMRGGVESPRNFHAAEKAISSSADRKLARLADAEWVVRDQATRVQARCSLWWNGVPRHEGERLGLIGRYTARESEAAAALLRRGCAELRQHGCTMAVGPMDGSTWGNYRLITERGDEPAFFLEPDTPDEWAAQFSAAGFFPLAHYYSSLVANLSETAKTGGDPARCRREMGIELRPIRATELESELPRIYEVVCRSFCRNLLYSPISERNFIAQYCRLLPYMRSELVLLAEQEGELIGFVFALPDFCQLARAPVIDTIIIKTLSVLPECSGAGLGSLLVQEVQQAARGLGYRRAIHALMHENNASRRISAAAKARTIRRYTLFAKRLDECH